MDVLKRVKWLIEEYKVEVIGLGKKNYEVGVVFLVYWIWILDVSWLGFWGLRLVFLCYM